MRNSPIRHRAFTLIELLVVVAIIAITIPVCSSRCQKVRYVAADSPPTTKQCPLPRMVIMTFGNACLSTAWRAPTNTDYTSGSWGYQILPHIDQQPLFDTQPANAAMAEPVAPYLCAIRGRPGYFTGSMTAAVTITVTRTPLIPSPPARATGPPVITTFIANSSVTVACGPQPEDVTINASGPANGSTYQLLPEQHFSV